MVRDSRHGKEYFDTVIAQYENDYAGYKKGLDGGEMRESKVPTLKGWIYSSALRRTISSYSAGYPVEDVKSSFENSLNEFSFLADKVQTVKENKFPLDFYNEVLWSVSLAVLLNLNEETFSSISKDVERYNKPDRLVDILLSFRLADRKINDNSYYESFSPKMSKRYLPLFEIYREENQEKQISSLKEYLKSWYRNQQLCAWYGNDKKHNYFGYWAFEAAAIAKIFNINDTSVEKNKYFPVGFEEYA